MQFKADDLRRHYASLTDDALTAVERDELVETAKKIYDEEIARRGLAGRTDDEGREDAEDKPNAFIPIGNESYDEGSEEPAWLPDAACACAFYNNLRRHHTMLTRRERFWLLRESPVISA
jgi:hypothetical protein